MNIAIIYGQASREVEDITHLVDDMIEIACWIGYNSTEIDRERDAVGDRREARRSRNIGGSVAGDTQARSGRRVLCDYDVAVRMRSGRVNSAGCGAGIGRARK